MTGVYLRDRLNILSCAVAGRPGKSAYDYAAAAGYTGTPEEFSAVLADFPRLITRVNVMSGRIDATLEQLHNRVADLELAAADLERRVAALEEAGA